MIKEFGPDQIQYKDLIELIVKVILNGVPSTKTAASNVLKELYRWIRGDIHKYIANLKEIQKVINLLDT